MFTISLIKEHIQRGEKKPKKQPTPCNSKVIAQ